MPEAASFTTSQVVARARAWIETFIRRISRASKSLSPARGRGLKLDPPKTDDDLKAVVARARAWIETFGQLDEDFWINPLSPARGRGLKQIKNRWYGNVILLSPARGRGLKLREAGKAAAALKLSPARGRGLKPTGDPQRRNLMVLSPARGRGLKLLRRDNLP